MSVQEKNKKDKQEDLKQSFESFFSAYYGRVFRFIYYRSQSKEIAKDITQQTFYKAWDYLKKGNQIKSPQAFCFMTARNLLANHYKSKHSHNIELNENISQTEGGFLNTSYQDASKNAEKSIDLINVKKALSKLSYSYREVIELKFLQDLSIEEISTVLNKSKISVYTSLHRALRKLKKILKEEGYI